MRQSETLLTIDERGSEIPTTSVFDCQWSPVRRLMAIEKSVSYYFWSTFVDNIDVFDCHQSGVNSLYASLCYDGHFCIQLNKIIWNCLCSKGRPLKKNKIKILMPNGSLMKVKSIAECSPWSILQYF